MLRAPALILALVTLIAAFALPAAADAPSHPPALVRLSDQGPAFMVYDGTSDLRASGRDWPVSLIFAGNASVIGVKTALRKLGFTGRGEVRYLAYREPSGVVRVDGDHGLKTQCDANGSDLHLRLYAPSLTDRFRDPEFGSVVVATTHIDRGDGCATPPTLFGFSEQAERRIAGRVSRNLHWRVQPNRLALGNAEPYRRDIADSAHVWWSDGRATLIWVP